MCFLWQVTSWHYQTVNKNEINLGATLETHAVYLIASKCLFKAYWTSSRLYKWFWARENKHFFVRLTKSGGQNMIGSLTHSCSGGRSDHSVIMVLNEVGRLKHKILCLRWYISGMKRVLLFFLWFCRFTLRLQGTDWCWLWTYTSQCALEPSHKQCF